MLMDDYYGRGTPAAQGKTNVRGQGSALVDMPALSLPKGHGPTMHQWSPYEDNGGTVAAIAGKGYVVVAGDTRLNGDYCILTRTDASKLYRLTNKTYLASSGMQADRLELQSMLYRRIQWYEHSNNGRSPSTAALAQLLSSILYSRRFFPLYTFNILVGLDENGDGVCYSYDAVGTVERVQYNATGSGSVFMEPLLDCFLRRHNNALTGGFASPPAQLSLPEAVETLKNAFTSCAERDTNTGDSVNFVVLTAENGLQEETLALRKD